MIKAGSSQFMYMAETEGYDSHINTRQARINAVIKEIRKNPKPVLPQRDFEMILHKHNLDYLSASELRQIQNGIL